MNLIFKLCPKQFNIRLSPQSKVAISQQFNFIAISTKQNQVVLYTKNNNRILNLGKCSYLVNNLVFTNTDLLVTEQGSHELYVFSLKSFKLKKKLASHRSKIIKIQYNSNRNLILTQSKQTCILWNSITFTKQKTLNCATSFFSDSTFTPNGQYLINVFDDDSIFYWTLDQFESSECKVRQVNGKLFIAADNNKYASVYCGKKLFIANYAFNKDTFHKIFEFDEQIKKVKFFSNQLLIMTENNLFLAKIIQNFKIELQIKRLLSNSLRDINVNYAHDYIIFINHTHDIFVSNLIEQFPNQKVKIENPLKNLNHFCAGGFGNQQGCQNITKLPSTNYYPINQQKMEKIYKSALISKQDLKQFSKQKLSMFLKKNFRFVDKHRAITYKFLLDLPSNVPEFKQLIRKGIHECTKLIPAKYPIKNSQLSDKLVSIVSLLSHYSPVFAEADNLASLVFPLVSIFGQDQLLCFQIIYRLFINNYQFFYEKFPLAHHQLIQNLEQILTKIDLQIIEHFKTNKLSITKLIWQLLSSCFSDVVNRQNYLSILDHLVCYRQTPQLLFFFVHSYIVYNKSIILSIKNDQGLDIFLNTQNNMHIGKYLTLTNKLFKEHKHLLRYKFTPVDWKKTAYIYFDRFPKEAVQVYRSKRQIEHKQYQYELENERFKDVISQKLNVVAVQQKIKIQSEAKLAEAYRLRFQNQKKNVVNVKKTDQSKRIQRLQNLVHLMKQNINIQQTVSRNINELPISIGQKQQELNDNELDKLQNKLIKLMINKPQQPIMSHLVHPIMPVEKAKQTQLLKSMLNIELIQGMRRINELQKKNQQKRWQKELLKVYQKSKQ